MNWDDEEAPAAPQKKSIAWLVTFTDLVSLLLTFFVLLFSMSSVQVDKWDKMIDALSQSISPSESEQMASPMAQYNIPTIFQRRGNNLDYLESILEEKMASNQILARSLVRRLDDRLVISLPGDLLFEKGNALISKRAENALFILGGVLRNINNSLGVGGHTDAVPLQNPMYSSNWELSVARAVAVANRLRASGYLRQISAYGYGDSMFPFLPKNITDEARSRLARRVDIVVLSTGGSS